MNYADFVESLPSSDEVEEFAAAEDAEFWNVPVLRPDHFQHLVHRRTDLSLKMLSQVVLPINRLFSAGALLPLDQKKGLTAVRWKGFLEEVSPLIRFNEEDLRILERLSRSLRLDRAQVWVPTDADSVSSAINKGRICIEVQSWSLSGIHSMSFRSTFFQMILVGQDWEILRLAESHDANKLVEGCVKV